MSKSPLPHPASSPIKVKEVSERSKYILMYSFAVALFFLALLFNPPNEIWEGNKTILISSANLLTDYFELANVGAALTNASFMALMSLGMLVIKKIKLSGPMIAAVFTVTGFSLFGKNLYNSLPIILGVASCAMLNRVSFSTYILSAMFGTALGPLVSEITFNLNLPLPYGILLGVLAGFITGFVLPPISAHMLRVHQGFNLYNIGFTAGLIGTFFIGLLRSFGIEVEVVSITSSGNNFAFGFILYPLFAIMFLIGFYLNGNSFKGYRKLLAQSGRLATDFVALFGFGLALINMALLGILSTSYVLLVGGELNGPVIGGIFTVVGFGAFGKHMKNVPPILLGIYLISIVNSYDIFSTQTLLAALFGTTLAPISGFYGKGAGILVGALHMAMVMNIGDLHAGMNLYNNGFSGGFVAAAMVPLFDNLIRIYKGFRKKYKYN